MSMMLPHEHGDGKIQGWHRDRLAAVYQLSELTAGLRSSAGVARCLAVRSLAVIEGDEPRDLSALVVPQAGRLEHAEDPWQPYRLCDPAGGVVAPVAAYLRELQARGRCHNPSRDALSHEASARVHWRSPLPAIPLACSPRTERDPRA